MGSPLHNSDNTFPAVDVAAELNPRSNTHVQVDPISAQVAAAKEIKEQVEAKQKEEREKKEAVQNIKSAIIVSGIVVAVAGAIFAITKKLREK